jgi:uncharacterized protein (TIGR02284 family)
MKSKIYENGESHPGTKVTGRHKKILHVLDDLIRIDIDRITGYEKAAGVVLPEASGQSAPFPSDFREVFYRLATESRSYVNELHAQVIRLGGSPVTQSTITGKIYLYWLGGKHRFEGPDIISILIACRESEEAVQQAYRQALDEYEDLPPNIHDLVENQLWSLERAYRRLLDLDATFNGIT